jgi:hypothetical protein
MLLARLCQCGRAVQQRLHPAASFATAPQALLRNSHTQEQQHRGLQAGASSSRSLSSTRGHTDESNFGADFETRKMIFDKSVSASTKRHRALKTLEDLNDEDEEGFITEDDYSDDEGAAGQVCGQKLLVSIKIASRDMALNCN